MGGWAIAGLVVLALIAIGAFTNSDDSGSSYTPSTSSVDVGTEYEVTADEVVDVMGPAAEAEFCGYYDQLGYSAGFTAFEGGYGSGQDPSAQEVYDELVSRC